MRPAMSVLCVLIVASPELMPLHVPHLRLHLSRLFPFICVQVSRYSLSVMTSRGTCQRAITERTSELVSALEPYLGMENGCEWRFHLPTSVGGFLCVVNFVFRAISTHILALGRYMM